jgi:four helix bundle protein
MTLTAGIPDGSEWYLFFQNFGFHSPPSRISRPEGHPPLLLRPGYPPFLFPPKNTSNIFAFCASIHCIAPSYHPIAGRLWVVRLGEELGRRIAQIISQWPSPEKRHPGDQLIRAIDSVGSNLTEGYARAHIKEHLRFYSFAQGSLEETVYWLRLCRERQLIAPREVAILSALCIKLGKGIDNLIAATNGLSANCDGGSREHRETLDGSEWNLWY